MSRPPFEVADVIRKAGDSFRQRTSLTWPQRKVLAAIARCRTAALGGHRDQCMRCGHQAISYNSCRNRHCPKCQTNAREKWLAKRQQELLPASYFHLVFSVPHALVPLMWQNQRRLFSLLFESSAATLLEVAADPKHLGVEIGFLAILHTWGQTLQSHPHIHCVVPGGGLSFDHSRWLSSRSSFFLPVKVLSRVFRGKFVAGLRRAFRNHQLVFYGECRALAVEKNFVAFLRTLFQQDWIVYAKPPFGGPEHVLHYLARYTHRVAISHHRLLSVSDSAVSFRWKDYAHGSGASGSMYYPEASPASATSAGQPQPKKPAATLPSSAPPAAASNPGFVLEPAYYLAVPSLPRPHVRHPTTHRCPDPFRRNHPHVLMTRPDRSLNPATLAGISPCSLNLCPALQNKPSCPAIGLPSLVWVPARCALSMSSHLYLWRYSPPFTDDRRG